VIQALRVSDTSTSRYLSELLGNQTVSQFNPGNPSATGVPNSMHSRAVLLPQEIRNIDRDELLNIIPGVGNFVAGRLPYFAPDSIWKGLYRSPPWFAAANAAAPPSLQEPPKRKGFFG
jgi:type IV secretory pathway TraG/TraD family ATPase VirD4